LFAEELNDEDMKERLLPIEVLAKKKGHNSR